MISSSSSYDIPLCVSLNKENILPSGTVPTGHNLLTAYFTPRTFGTGQTSSLDRSGHLGTKIRVIQIKKIARL